MGKIAKTLRKNLKKRMSDLNISQSELSRLSGVAQPQISQVLSGDRNATLRTIELLSKALQIPVHRLFLDP